MLAVEDLAEAAHRLVDRHELAEGAFYMQGSIDQVTKNASPAAAA